MESKKDSKDTREKTVRKRTDFPLCPSSLSGHGVVSNDITHVREFVNGVKGGALRNKRMQGTQKRTRAENRRTWRIIESKSD